MVNNHCKKLPGYYLITSAIFATNQFLIPHKCIYEDFKTTLIPINKDKLLFYEQLEAHYAFKSLFLTSQRKIILWKNWTAQIYCY